MLGTLACVLTLRQFLGSDSLFGIADGAELLCSLTELCLPICDIIRCSKRLDIARWPTIGVWCACIADSCIGWAR